MCPTHIQISPMDIFMRLLLEISKQKGSQIVSCISRSKNSLYSQNDFVKGHVFAAERWKTVGQRASSALKTTKRDFDNDFKIYYFVYIDLESFFYFIFFEKTRLQIDHLTLACVV